MCCAPPGDNGGAERGADRSRVWSRRGSTIITESVETMEETMYRLSTEIELAIEANDPVRAARAQKELMTIELEKPCAACRVVIHKDCRRAATLLQQGESVSIDDRIKAARKLGWWLRWKRGGVRGLVPTALALEGLLWALRSEPEVAWTAQCALYHAAKGGNSMAQSVSHGPRGTVTRFLLQQRSSLPFYLPKPTERTIETYERAMKTDAVVDFLLQLRSLTLVDPGYGEDSEPDAVTERLSMFARALGRNLESLENLTALGFGDCAMTHVLARLAATRLPSLKSMTIMGTCNTDDAQMAILSTLNRHAPTLQHLELNIWTDFLCDAVDPFVEIGVMPNLKRLTIRAPPLAVPWEHFAECFPALEELTFLYSQDFAHNAVEVLDECEHPAEQQELLKQHALWQYRDAVLFARDLHKHGFRRLARQCKSLKEIRISVIDTSNGYDVTPADERLGLLWRRDESPDVAQHFRRDARTNNDTRATLEAQAELLETQSDISEDWWGDRDSDSEAGKFDYDMYDSDLEAEYEDEFEEAASIAASTQMMQVVRLFDDPSLEADFGLRPFS